MSILWECELIKCLIIVSFIYNKELLVFMALYVVADSMNTMA